VNLCITGFRGGDDSFRLVTRSCNCDSMARGQGTLASAILALGRFPCNQNLRKLRSGTEWNGSDQPDNFRKRRSTFWGGPLFRLVRSDRKLLFHSKKLRFVVPLCRKFLEISVRNWMERLGPPGLVKPSGKFADLLFHLPREIFEISNRNFWSNGKRPLFPLVLVCIWTVKCLLYLNDSVL